MASRTLKPSDKDAKFYEDLRKANQEQTERVRKARGKPSNAPAEQAPEQNEVQ